MKRTKYTEFREKVEKGLLGENDGLTWDQLKKKAEILQIYLCYILGLDNSKMKLD